MRRTLLYLLLLTLILVKIAFSEEVLFVEKNEFDAEMQKLKNSITQLRKSNGELKNIIIEQNKRIDTLRRLIDDKDEGVKRNITTFKQETQTQILDITETINKSTTFWIVITGVILLLCVGIYLVLRMKLTVKTRTLDEQINKTRSALEAEAIKLDSKLMEVLETQLLVCKEQLTLKEHAGTETDHSLGLRVGEEIFRMRKRMQNMPEDTRGLGALRNSVKRLEEEFNTSGYEIVDLAQTQYNEGMIASVRFLPSDELKQGEKIISKVIKPQINYKGVLIKAAEIDVSTGG